MFCRGALRKEPIVDTLHVAADEKLGRNFTRIDYHLLAISQNFCLTNHLPTPSPVELL